jgi:hypothetical protein
VRSSATPPARAGHVEPRRDRAVDPFWVSRQSLDADAATFKPGCGWLPRGLELEAAARRATLRILSVVSPA